LITQNLRIKFEPYIQLLTDVPVSETEQGFSMLNVGADFEIPLKENLVNKGKGQNYGAELTVEHFFDKNFYFLTTLSLYSSKYTDYEGTQRNTEFNGNFVYNLLGGYEFKLWKNSKLAINAKTVWAGGKRYVPILSEESVNAGYIIYDWDNAYTDKRDDFFRLDLNIRLKINRKRVSHEIGIELQNLTNHQNIFTKYFDVYSGTYKKEYQVGFFALPTYKIYF